MSTLVWKENSWQPANTLLVSATDGGFLYGDTLFESLLLRHGKVLFLCEHLDRLELSAHLSEFPFDRAATMTQLQKALTQCPLETGRLRLTLTRGEFQGLGFPAPDATLILTLAPYVELTIEQRASGWRAVSAPNQRVNPLSHLPQMKRGNYADCLYAFNHARSCGADEAVFFSPENQLLEGSISNVFLVNGNRLLTPHLGGLVLAGVIRRQLLSLAGEVGLEAVEAEIHQVDLFSADEVLLCNSLLLVIPLVELDGRALPRGERWRELLAKIDCMVDVDRDE